MYLRLFLKKSANPGLFWFISVLFKNIFTEKLWDLAGIELGP